jgi:hypothetical protein
MTWSHESVSTGYVISPSFNLFGFDLNRLSTLSADQVMVMLGSAGSVEQLSVFALQAVSFSLDSKIG